MTLEVVKFRDLVAVNSLRRFVPGLATPTLEILGEDFSSVDEVRFNETSSPEFYVVNKTTLWAAVPNEVKQIRTVSVISSKFTKTASASKMEFRIGNSPKKVTGILKLSQLFTKWMLQTPGSDIYNQDRGGGLQGLVGRIESTRNMQPLIASVTRSIDMTSDQIRQAQIRTALPASEKLLSAELIDFRIFEDRMEASVRVRLISIAGGDAVAALEL